MSESNTQSDSQNLMIDIRALGTINQLADIAVRGVSKNLSMLGDDTDLSVQRVNFVNLVRQSGNISSDTSFGIRASISDTLNGHLLVQFTEEDAKKLTKPMLSEVSEVTNEVAQSAAEDIGQMMLNGFVDEWADAFSSSIGTSTPNLVSGREDEIVSSTASLDDNPFAMVFRTRIEMSAGTVHANFYLFPDMEEFVALVNKINS